MGCVLTAFVVFIGWAGEGLAADGRVWGGRREARLGFSTCSGRPGLARHTCQAACRGRATACVQLVAGVGPLATRTVVRTVLL